MASFFLFNSSSVCIVMCQHFRKRYAAVAVWNITIQTMEIKSSRKEHRNQFSFHSRYLFTVSACVSECVCVCMVLFCFLFARVYPAYKNSSSLYNSPKQLIFVELMEHLINYKKNHGNINKCIPHCLHSLFMFNQTKPKNIHRNVFNRKNSHGHPIHTTGRAYNTLHSTVS